MRIKMEQIKDISIETIKKMPDNTTIEDIMYRLNLVSKVMEGLDDVNSGKVITTNELLRKVDEWVVSTGQTVQ